MRKLSLFSGIGGIDLAAQWAGMETVAFCEREPFPQSVLRKHWPNVPIYDDVCTLTKEALEQDGIGTIDIISAGYPCQPFSVAGKREGEGDDRHLWPEVRRLIKEIRPRWFIGENVAGHVTLGLDDVLSDLGSLGYTFQPFVIPASAVYASHRRDRVFIVAYTNSFRNYSEGKYRNDGDGQKENEKRQQSQCRFSDNSEIMANTTSAGLERPAGTELQGGSSRSALCGKNVADTGSAGQQKRNSTSIADRSGYDPGRNYAGRSERSTQPIVGRSTHELPVWLDGRVNPLDVLADMIANHRQPALQGMPQHDWEPPRVAMGVKNRTARLKALGNAVNPLQIYPILHAIKLIEDSLAG